MVSFFRRPIFFLKTCGFCFKGPMVSGHWILDFLRLPCALGNFALSCDLQIHDSLPAFTLQSRDDFCMLSLALAVSINKPLSSAKMVFVLLIVSIVNQRRNQSRCIHGEKAGCQSRGSRTNMSCPERPGAGRLRIDVTCYIINGYRRTCRIWGSGGIHCTRKLRLITKCYRQNARTLSFI